METSESSDYVKARSKLLADYFAKNEWVVSDGKNNNILIYISSDGPFVYGPDQLADFIGESDLHLEWTALRMSRVTYRFFHQGTLVGEIAVLPTTEFDV